MAYIPQPGDYGVVKTNGWAAKLIQFGTRSRWNHAFIYIGDDKIIEANPTGVEISSVFKYEKISWNQHEGLVPEMRQHIISRAQHFVGQPYGFADIGNLILRMIGFKFLANTSLLERLAVRNGVICSELVSLCYKGVGIPVTTGPDHLVTPGDLAERLTYQ
jgi:hypothetical protein